MPADLAIGEVRNEQIRADAVHAYRLALDADQAYLLELDQGGLDLVVAIHAPDGLRRDYNAPLLRLERERLLLEPLQDGDYLIELGSTEFTGAQAQYTLVLKPLSMDGEPARVRRAALRNETLAAAAYFKGGADAWNEVIAGFRAALDAWLALDERSSAARARLALASVLYHQLTDWHASMREAERAAELYLSVGNRSAYASAIHLQAAALIEEATQLGRQSAAPGESQDATTLFAEARQLLDQALDIKSELGESYEAGRIINSIAASYYFEGVWNEARARMEEAASLFRDSDEWSEELTATMNLGVIDLDQGRLMEALDAFSRVLELATADALPELHGNTLDNMSVAYRALGDVDSALASSLGALRLHEARGELKAQGMSLASIGIAYFQSGDLERAREHLEAALEIHRRANDGRSQAAALRILGSIYSEEHDFPRAIAAHREAASLGGSTASRIRAEVLLGADLAAAGQLDEALEILNKASAGIQDGGSPVMVAQARLERGAALRRLRESAKSEADLGAALELFRTLGLSRHEARTAFELAKLSRDNARPDDAAAWALKAIELIERQRGMIRSPDFRAAFLGSHQDYYHLYIDLLVSRYLRSGDKEALRTAFETSERSRSRALIDLLAESAVDLATGHDPELRERETKFHQELAGLRYRHEALLRRNASPQELADVLQKLRRVEAELDLLEAAVRRDSPAYVSTRSPVLQDLSSIQRQLDADSVLVQYVLGNPRSFVFVVTDISVEVVPLSPGSEIAALARQAHERLSTHDPGMRDGGPSPLNELAARVLWPIQPLIGRPRLIVVADGALHYVPFVALPLRHGEDESMPLLLTHEVASVPSMSVLAEQRQQLAARDPPGRIVAVIADPVFGSQDPRFSTSYGGGSPGTLESPPMPSAGWQTDALHRLPATGNEAVVITALVPEPMRTVMTGLAANRNAVLNLPLNDYRILHLATHGLIDSRYPALSALALSSYDTDGRAMDGRVRLRDIYSMRLNADLVVLSACNTALGRELRGEGLVGLTRGFQYAGARTVVASLWQVPDQATAKLIEALYEGLLGEGKTAVAALREAQLTIANTRRWSDPYFWAALVAYGEWQKKPIGPVG